MGYKHLSLVGRHYIQIERKLGKHSWKRGQNEYAHGLLRQFFPKTMKLNNFSAEQVTTAVDKLNNRPRKCLKYKTPYEMFYLLTGVNVENIISCALIT
jgi:IS30 family transposase